jgi:Fic family protein
VRPGTSGEYSAISAGTLAGPASGFSSISSISSVAPAISPTYYDSLKAAQQRLEWQELVGFVSDAIVATVNELLATRDALRRLGAIWRNRRKFRKDSGAERALDVLPHYPVLTIRRLSRLLGISTPAATTAVEQLIETG